MSKLPFDKWQSCKDNLSPGSSDGRQCVEYIGHLLLMWLIFKVGTKLGIPIIEADQGNGAGLEWKRPRFLARVWLVEIN